MTIEEANIEYNNLKKERFIIECEFEKKMREYNEKMHKVIDDYVKEHRKFNDGDIICLVDSLSENPRKCRITKGYGVEYLQGDKPYIDIRYETEGLNGGKGLYGGWSIPEDKIKLAN